MDIKERALTKAEQMYVYRQEKQINAHCGLIGYLRADFGSNGKEFWSTWEEFNNDLKTSEFANVFDDVINTLRCADNFLSGLSKMRLFCNSKEEYCIEKERSFYGVRIDTEKYSFLFKLIPRNGDYNCYCYCYLKEYLDEHLMKASKGIRFITSHYRELFKIKDGDSIVITMPNGETAERTCRYIDDYHIFVGCDCFHICEFAEKMEKCGNTISKKLNINCFIEDCLSGDADISDVDYYVEYWHSHSELKVSLREFLGLTETEYETFVKSDKSDQEFFESIIVKRKNSTKTDINNN